MKPIGKSFSNKTIENLLLGFEGIKVETQIMDKPRKVTDYHYCRSQPKVRKNPRLVGISRRVLDMLGYDEEALVQDQNSPYYLSGSKLIQGSVPVAHNYCGYQFGVWAGQLGDGRAHTIGHVVNQANIYELQLKGSGLSPFSRHADGNSVVSSAVRQFLCSELMAGLGIPTTRALSLVIAEEDVIRDPFYNGMIKVQNAAIVIRVAQAFLRFGSFQVCNRNAQMQKPSEAENRKILTALADYLLKYVYTDINPEEGDPYEQMFHVIVSKTAELVAKWQSVGFVHGVLNTDNMSMVNVTIDYGPFGFIDYFSKDFVSNATDQYERYSYRQQPSVVKWNLMRLAQAFDPLVPTKALKKYINQNFDVTFQKQYDKLMAAKLGLEPSEQSRQLVKQLLDLMHTCGSNFTNVFRKLASDLPGQQLIQAILIESLPTDYYKKGLRLIANPNIPQQQIAMIMQQDDGFNQYFLVEQRQRKKLMQALSSETCEARTSRERQLWATWIDKYHQMSPNKELQNKNTVRYVLLNEIAKNITEELNSLKQAEEQRDFMGRILDVFASPHSSNQWFETKFWSRKPVPVRLTCSS